MVTHPSSNQAQHRLTSLIETNALSLRQTATALDIIQGGPENKTHKVSHMITFETFAAVSHCLHQNA